MLTRGGLKWLRKKHYTGMAWLPFQNEGEKKYTQEETNKICEKPHTHKHM